MSEELKPKPFNFDEAIKAACRSGPERTLIRAMIGEITVLRQRIEQIEKSCSACQSNPAPKTTKKTPSKTPPKEEKNT
jgi:hypothetical protein